MPRYIDILKRIETKTKDEKDAIDFAIASIALLEMSSDDANKPIAVGWFTWRGDVTVEEFEERIDAVIEMYIRDLRAKMKRNAILITEENAGISIARLYYSEDKNVKIR